MAPTGNPAKARKSTSNKSGGPKPIVPAIPLPHVKRQVAAKAAAAQASERVANSTAPSPAVASPVAKKFEVIANSPGPSESSQTRSSGDTADSSKPGKPTNVVSASVTPSNEVLPLENGHYDAPESATASANSVTDSPNSSAPPTASEDDKHTQTNPRSVEYGINDAHPNVPTSALADNSTPAKQAADVSEVAPGDDSVKQGRARPPPSIAPISPTRYQMPPPFHPANRVPPGMASNGEMIRGPRPPMPNGPHIHHSHPSNGSAVHFGTFNGSANSSPAPPHSGGIAPPPGMHMNDGRPPYMGPPGNGFPPMMPMGNDMMPLTHFEGYARPNMGYAPHEPFQAYGNHFGPPSTPHSLQGSQSSGHLDDAGIPTAYQPGHPRAGANGFSQDFQSQQLKDRSVAQDFPRMEQSQTRHHHSGSVADNSGGLLDYLRQQFGSSALSDSIVELRYLDHRAAPVRVPGHQLIFARSAALGATKQGQNSGEHVIQVETDSKWVRSDAFYMALQPLYGLPLLPVPPPISGMNGGDFTEAGSLDERFDFALAYAAAGGLLEWEPVLQRGCEVAAQLLTWQTLEKALEFALEEFVDKGTFESYKYGAGSKILLHAIANFVANCLPPTFVLDVAAPESPLFSRLPLDPGSRKEAAAPEPFEKGDSVIVRGSQNGRTGKGHRHQLSSIQFGDLSLTEGAQGPASETPRASQQARPISHDILSRVLVSVPFTILQMIFDPNGPGNMRGWVNTEACYRLMKETIVEREARRSRVLDAVMGGQIMDRHDVLQQLRSPEPRNLDRWGVLGWQEELLSRPSRDGPAIGRRWAPLQDGSAMKIAEFP